MSEQRTRFWIRTAALTVILAACSGGDGTGPGNQTNVNQYMSGLPGWDEFSPPGMEHDSLVDSTRQTAQSIDTVASVKDIDAQGNVTTRSDVAYACTSVPYSIARTPREIVLYNPDLDILWPGALLQGKSHTSKVGSLAALTIAERNPINVSIPQLPTGSNFRTVDTVDQAHVGSAIGAMVGSAVDNNLQTPSATSFSLREASSEKEFALQAGLSGKYLGFSAKVGVGVNHSSSEHTVAVHFLQRMFDVVVAPPQTPGDMFSSAFTPAKLQQQIDLGRIGADNPPIYVSQITYGRMMMFTLTSTASYSDIKGTLDASYKFVTGQAALNLSTRQQSILSESRIDITAIGGNDSATAAMIRTGDWRDYFTASTPLSKAAPISYTFRNLSDGSTASVTEATDYDIRTCTEYSNLPGQLDFLPQQSLATNTGTDVRLVDVNGDSLADLVWNQRAAASNQIGVALGQPNGTFGAPSVTSHPVAVTSEGWPNFVLTTGDFSGENPHLTDLAWTYFANGVNKTYIARSTGTGWTFDPPVSRPESRNWTGFKVLAGDTDGDGDDDLIFSQLATNNITYVSLSNGDGTFDTNNLPLIPAATGWSPYQVWVGSLDGNVRQDLIWNSVNSSQPNRTYTGRFNTGGVTYSFAGPADHPTSCCWTGYQRIIGDFNGDGRTDLYFSSLKAGGRALHMAQANGSGGWSFLLPYLTISTPGSGAYLAYVTDLDGDNKSDIVWNQLTSSANTVQTARGLSNGRVDVTLAGQHHPVSTNWVQAVTLVGDVNHDHRGDVVWVIPGASTQVYVGLARP